MIRAALLVLALLAAAPAWADCDAFKWSVAKDREAFAATEPLAAVSDGAVGKGYAVSLVKDPALTVKPEREPKPGTYGAEINFAKLAAGTYQVTLSQDAWIDVSQNGVGVKSSDFSGQHDCPAVRKSVRFKLSAGPATVEISNASASALNLVVEPAP